MIKRIIKRIAYKFYNIGRFEYLRIENERRTKEINSKADISKSAWISDSAMIINNAHPREKIVIGSNSRIMGSLLLFDFDGRISIGSDCFIGPDTRVWSSKSISIGNRVLIAHNVNIHDNISHPLNAKDRYLENCNFVQTGTHLETDIKGQEIIIEDDVWIGFNSMILRGVRIGRGAIIGAGSVVTKDVEPWTVNVGNPIRCIRKLEPESFNYSENSIIK